MSTLGRERIRRRLADEARRERSAFEYYSLMALITEHLESRNVFMQLAEVRFKNLQKSARSLSLEASESAISENETDSEKR